jgi:hypothetical protein
MIRFAVVLLTSLAAFGETIVILDTSSLESNANAPFTLDFTFIDGSGSGDGSNTITLSNFVLGAGSLTLSSTTGGITVNASPFSVLLTNTSFFNDVEFTFVPDASLTFQIDATSNAEDSTPDTFTVGILDRNFVNIPTSNPNNQVAFIELDLPVNNPPTGTQLILSGSTANDDDVTIATPTVSSGAPEPSTFVLLGLSLLMMAARYSARKSHSNRRTES